MANGLTDLLGGIGKAVGSFGKASSPESLNYLAQANQASAPGLSLFQQSMAAPMIDQGAQAKQQAVQEMAAAINTGTPDGYIKATAIMAKIDPESAKSMLPKLMELNPEIKGKLGYSEQKGQTEGQMESLTKYGSNPKQLKLLDLKEAKIKSATGDGKDARFNKSMIRQYQKDFNSAAKTVEDQLNNLGGLSNFTEMATKNPMAAAQLGVKVAKAMGEVGALSESDVRRYVQNPAMAQKVSGEVLKLAKGTILPENAKYLRESLQAIAAIAADRDRFLKSKFIKQVSRNMDLNEEEAAFKLGLDASSTDQLPSEQQAPLSTPSQEAVTIQGTSIKAPVGAKVRSKSTGKIMTVQSDGSLK